MLWCDSIPDKVLVENCIVNTIMIEIRLKDAMEAYRSRTGVRLTYEVLAEQTGLSLSTLQSIASRANYNPRLSTIEALCEALDCLPGDLLMRSQDKPNDD